LTKINNGHAHPPLFAAWSLEELNDARFVVMCCCVYPPGYFKDR
jgi:hypothetical protein